MFTRNTRQDTRGTRKAFLLFIKNSVLVFLVSALVSLVSLRKATDEDRAV